MDRMNKLQERLVSSKSDYVQAALRLAEGQGNKNHFFKQYEECFGDFDDETPYGDFRQKKYESFVTLQMEKVLKTTYFFYPFKGETQLQTPYNEISSELFTPLIEFLFCNAGLGNRGPTKEGFENKECIYCAVLGNYGVRMSEHHILLECERFEPIRQRFTLSNYIQNVLQEYNNKNQQYVAFWGKYSELTVTELEYRISFAIAMRSAYLKDVVKTTEFIRHNHN